MKCLNTWEVVGCMKKSCGAADDMQCAYIVTQQVEGVVRGLSTDNCEQHVSGLPADCCCSNRTHVCPHTRHKAAANNTHKHQASCGCWTEADMPRAAPLTRHTAPRRIRALHSPCIRLWGPAKWPLRTTHYRGKQSDTVCTPPLGNPSLEPTVALIHTPHNVCTPTPLTLSACLSSVLTTAHTSTHTLLIALTACGTGGCVCICM